MPKLLLRGKRLSGLLLGLLLGLASPNRAWAQSKYMTRAGHISFFSASIMEDIEARNDKAAAVFDLGTGQVAFSVPIHEFQFKRTLMQEHFNENYMESEKYPKATFTGQLLNAAQLLKQLHTATQTVEVEGNLTMHGVTHKAIVTGTLQLRDGQLVVFAYFNIAPADFSIDIPLLVREHIAKSVSVRINLTCDAVTPALVAQP
ncbi:YceI family protein [Hymenobacter sp. H14-R3]|uniref:YceI family protein n=1 Tax=Hymenobacter sp. H14-R3 TaxID=3046308 RepID=UPI0024B90A8C|nr:YceI family protein [Hymenobacter sp. H14-R3]MDJ0363637.1 YceI family protein [Hymenobacter sp. H14-R3]